MKSHIKTKFTEFVNEANYNYHIGDLGDLTNIRPHLSDNKFRMRGRDTGHFGSGVYFSTYKLRETSPYINHDEKDDTRELVQINDGVYRVDFDIYNNLYRVYDNKHGDILFNTLKLVNGLYTMIVDYEQFDDSTTRRYLILKKNCTTLHLKCPEYKEFIRMCQKLAKNENDIRSMSTLFMEYNGYNGVNVSGVYNYDNTLHGSVIYDLSKTTSDIEKVNPRLDSRIDIERSENDYVAGELFDLQQNLLVGKDYISIYLDKFLALDNKLQVSVIKRYQYVLDDTTIDKLNDDVKKAYFKSLPYKFKNNLIKSKIDKWFIRTLIDNGQLNILFNPELKYKNETLFAIAIDVLYTDEVRQLLGKINRELTDDEKKQIQYIVDDGIDMTPINPQ